MALKRKNRSPVNPPRQDKPLEVEIFAAEAIQGFIEPPEGATDMQKLETVCLEICQKTPLVAPPEQKLVSQTTEQERQEMLTLAANAGMKVEGLISIIRHSHGIHGDVLLQLRAMQPRK